MRWIIFFFIGFPLSFFPQFALFPPDYFLAYPTWQKIFFPSDTLHPTLFPYNELSGNIYKYQTDTTRVFRYIAWDQGIDKVFYDPLIAIRSKKEPVEVNINPVLHWRKGFDNIDTLRTSYSINTRGISGTIRIGQKVLIETMFAENQSFFPYYLSQYVRTASVVPGQGRYKLFKQSGYDYAWSAGMISWQIFRNVNLQAGHFKNKIGSGYRSVLLSDESFLYPQLKLTAGFFKNRCQYTVWAASLMDLDSAYEKPIPGLERLFRKKPLSMQYLQVNIHKTVRLGFFQSLTGMTNNGKNRFQAEKDIFIPLPFAWPLYRSFPAASHILWGTDVLIIPSSLFHVYGQYAIRNDSTGKMNREKFSWQIGTRCFIPRSAPVTGMFYAEINNAPQDFYSPSQNRRYYASYSVYRESMGLPFFISRETRVGGIIMKNRWGAQGNYVHQGLHDSLQSSIQHVKMEVFYLVNRSYLLTVFVSYHYRFHDFPTFTLRENTMQMWSFGFRTRLYQIHDEY